MKNKYTAYRKLYTGKSAGLHLRQRRESHIAEQRGGCITEQHLKYLICRSYTQRGEKREKQLVYIYRLLNMKTYDLH